MENNPSYDTILSQIGCKNTKSRKIIIEVLTKTEVPLSAEEIFLNVKESGSSTNLSTVYRTLDLLESKGMLDKYIMSDGRARYKLALEGHKHHITCINCYKSIPINTCPIESLEKDLVNTTDFNITGHKLEVYGLCPKCRKGE
ncbi:Fur family transcriptional regulator [Acetivibrio clariflavus]|uniref:Fe2+/Zn2+ uptake regulation protein n=1 Tax=Acetivibrio clariflavus (strain DSM 19732 / NBRC 101661 / EBR45) TaxID=720554 RepID=G8M1E7_ACECE|nr:transcriptional repressor [Acetivibrio clariflavus]AEV69162.1 Fe2+/Zn2+ uptake regulation protein [Acetivibrio clariflavus DSM 19732]